MTKNKLHTVEYINKMLTYDYEVHLWHYDNKFWLVDNKWCLHQDGTIPCGNLLEQDAKVIESSMHIINKHEAENANTLCRKRSCVCKNCNNVCNCGTCQGKNKLTSCWRYYNETLWYNR